MKNFKDYKGFMDDIIKRVLDLDIECDFIVTFSCLEPILKDNRPSYKRVQYVEVCGWNNTSNDIVWFNDWFEGYQTSFDIESIIDITEVSKIQTDLNIYKNMIKNISYLSREVYEAAGLLEEEFRKEVAL